MLDGDSDSCLSLCSRLGVLSLPKPVNHLEPNLKSERNPVEFRPYIEATIPKTSPRIVTANDGRVLGVTIL